MWVECCGFHGLSFKDQESTRAQKIAIGTSNIFQPDCDMSIIRIPQHNIHLSNYHIIS
jgi:hypothetical protein